MASQRRPDSDGPAGSAGPAPSSLDGRWLLAAVLLLSLLVAWLCRPTEPPLMPAVRSAVHEVVPPPPKPTLAVPTHNPTAYVIPPGQEETIKGWGQDGDEPVVLPDGARIDSITIQEDHAQFIVATGEGVEAVRLGSVRVYHPKGAPDDARIGTELAVVVQAVEGEPVAPAVEALAGHLAGQTAGDVFVGIGGEPIVAHEPATFRGLDTTDFVIAPDDPVRLGMHAKLGEQLRTTFQLTALLAALALAVCSLRRRPVTVPVVGKLNHLLPAVLQITIFSYWWLHWPPGRHLALLIVPQIIVAYFVEISLSSLSKQSWAASFGNLPVVLSTNLLAQFVGATVWVSLLSVSLAVAAKVFLRREGRPVFNPSALGLTLMGLVQIFVPGIEGGDFTHEFSSPPNISELVFLLALIVQLRLKLTLITLSAAVWMTLAVVLLPVSGFGVTWAPFLLVICLLITDPSTIPRTSGGRILYALVVVVCMLALQALFFSLGMSDFWSKVMAIPLANLLAPWFDSWGRRLNDVAWLDTKHNRWHVVAWAVVFALHLGDKAGMLDSQEPPISPCYVEGEGEGDACERNPMFCTPFSVGREAECWFSAGERAGSDGP